MKLTQFLRVRITHGPTPLEFMPRMTDALKNQADTIITQGATQSNHARQTVAIAAKMGMKCEILLEAWLQRLVDDGVIEKQKKPPGYIVKQSSHFE